MTSFVAAGDFDRLRREIKQYQTEQELELLKIGMPRDRKYTLEPTISRNKILEDRSLERLIDVDCCLVVDNTNSKGNYKSLALWPLALVACYGAVEKYADLGKVEQHGSLWRLQKYESAHSTVNTVILQSTEIGESVFYLTSELELTESMDSAARWEVHFSNPSETSSVTSSVALGLPAILGDPKGPVVQFALVEGDGGDHESHAEFSPSSSGSAGKGAGHSSEPRSIQRFLVSARSSEAGQGIALLTFEQIVASIDSGEGIDWSVSWEIVPEESCAGIAPMAGAEFLDEAASASAEDQPLY